MFRFEELGALFREISVFAKISGGGNCPVCPLKKTRKKSTSLVFLMS